MFTKIFDKLRVAHEAKKTGKTITFNYIINELIMSFFKPSPQTSTPKKTANNNSISEKDKELKFLKNLRLKRNRIINKRLFVSKEEFLDTFDNFNGFFKNEWKQFYFRNLHADKLWLLYTLRPFYINGYMFYIRHKNLFNLFNLRGSTKNIGKYNKDNKKLFNNLYWGFLSFWKILKIWTFSLVIFSGSFYLLMIKRSSVLPQTLFFWVGLSMLLYWLISGFVFFVKKYQFSRFTSVIQRFWRRSYILFWLIESGLLLVFFYLVINSSQESFYMFDQSYFFKTHLFSWKLFLFKCILVVSLITYSYLMLLNLKWSVFNKNIINLLFITGLLIYFVWIEFYQIYWVSNFYANFFWSYDFEDLNWTLEYDGRRTRILNHYIMVLFLLKFWHIIFIFSCWIFFVLRANELESISFSLYSFNFQNFIILFLMMWLFMYPWFKHTYHWLAEISYYWFYVDIHVSFIKILIHDCYNFYFNIIYNFIVYKTNIAFNAPQFINWALIDNYSDCNLFIKLTIKNNILQTLL